MVDTGEIEVVESTEITDLSIYGLETDSEVVTPPEFPPLCNDIVIKNSKDVHVGNRNYYTGPITFKKVVIPTGDFEGGSSNSAVHLCNAEGEKQEASKKVKWWKSPYTIAAITVAILILSGIITYVFIHDTSTQDDLTLMNSTLRLKRRSDWAAREPMGTIKALREIPAPFVIITHTVTKNCSTFSSCASIVSTIQASHMSLGFDDIGLNFLAGGDGYIYEGRGWDKWGAHTLPFNRYSIGVGFIGDFMLTLPPKRQINAAHILLEDGVKTGKLKVNYKLLFQKQVSATESPGAALIEEIKKWPHWTICDDDCNEIIRESQKPKA